MKYGYGLTAADDEVTIGETGVVAFSATEALRWAFERVLGRSAAEAEANGLDTYGLTDTPEWGKRVVTHVTIDRCWDPTQKFDGTWLWSNTDEEWAGIDASLKRHLRP